MLLGRLSDQELPLDPVFEFLDMRDDPDRKMLVFQPLEAVHHDVHKVFVEGTEALVQKEKFNGTQRTGTDLRAQRQRQRERNEKRLTARKRIDAAQLPAVVIVPDKEPALIAQKISAVRERQQPSACIGSDRL